MVPVMMKAARHFAWVVVFVLILSACGCAADSKNTVTMVLISGDVCEKELKGDPITFRWRADGEIRSDGKDYYLWEGEVGLRYNNRITGGIITYRLVLTVAKTPSESKDRLKGLEVHGFLIRQYATAECFISAFVTPSIEVTGSNTRLECDLTRALATSAGLYCRENMSWKWMDGVVKETDPGQRWGDCFIRMSIECHRDNKARAAKEILARNSLMITKGKLVMVKEEG